MREARAHDSFTHPDMKDLGELSPEKEGLSLAENTVLENVVWRKLDRWTIPLCTSFFLLAFLVCLYAQFQAQYVQ